MYYENFNLIPILGFSGSGKSSLMETLKLHGEQTVCLEEIAGIKGVCLRNLFGQFDMPPDEFEFKFNNLFQTFIRAKPVWVEWKPPSIHLLPIPSDFTKAIYSKTAFVLTEGINERVSRMLVDYSELTQYITYVIDGFHESNLLSTDQIGYMREYEKNIDPEGLIRYLLEIYFDPFYSNELMNFSFIKRGQFQFKENAFIWIAAKD